MDAVEKAVKALAKDVQLTHLTGRSWPPDDPGSMRRRIARAVLGTVGYDALRTERGALLAVANEVHRTVDEEAGSPRFGLRQGFLIMTMAVLVPIGFLLGRVTRPSRRAPTGHGEGANVGPPDIHEPVEGGASRHQMELLGGGHHPRCHHYEWGPCTCAAPDRESTNG